MLDIRKGLFIAAAFAAGVFACARACFLTGDLNGDCRVDLEDLSVLALQWLSPPPVCEETGLGGYWKLDETDGIAAEDASGNERTGEVEGEPVWRAGGGYLKGAMEFDGADDAVRITGYAGITGRNARTCSAWVRTYRSNVDILTWGDSSGAGRRWVVCLQGDGLLRLDAGTGYVDGSTYINDGEWHHVAVTFEGTRTDDVRLFVDGMLEVVSKLVSQDVYTASGNDVCMGTFEGPGRYFRGMMDEVRIYERAFSMEEVWALARTDTADVGCADVHGGDGVNMEDFARLAENWQRRKSAVLINEFMADNESTLATTVGGEERFEDWIELYNASSLTVDLGGWYLTDNRDNLTKWEFPAGVVLGPGEFLVVFASGQTESANSGNWPFVDDEGYLHTNFKLSNDGEYLGLVQPDGETIAHEYAVFEFSPYKWGFGPQEDDISYGMLYDEMRYFAIPTPGAPNNGAFMGYVADTKFSHDRGFYDGAFELRIRCSTPGAIIRYTTDGSEPTQAGNGRRYTGPILVDRTTTLRAMAYKAGWAPSNVDTQTYIFIADVIRQSPDGAAPSGQWPSGSVNGQALNYGMDPQIVDSEEYGGLVEEALAAIPTISIVTNLRNLFDPATGIYVNALRDGREWERPASVELLDPRGGEGFHINAGLRIRGGYSRADSNPKHAFRLFFRGEYGSRQLDYRLFGDEGVSRFEKVDLRTSQNYSWAFNGDSRNTMVREVFSRDMQRDMGQPYTRSRYYHLYLDGQYWGLFQTQERSEARYAASYLGGEVADYDVVKVDAGPGRPYVIEATDGDLEACERLWNAGSEGFAGNEAYFGVQGLDPNGVRNPDRERLVDVDNLIDYMISTFYVGDCDSPISWFLGNNKPNNFYGIYNRSNPDGFKWFRHDAEHSLFTMSRNRDRTGPYPAGNNFAEFNPQWLHQRLSENSEYRERFGDRVHRYFFNSGLLTGEQAAANVMSRAEEIETAIVAESARWGDAQRAEPFTKADWLNEIVELVEGYFPYRGATVLSQFQGKKWYPTVAAPRFYVNASHRHGGHVSSEDFIAMSAPEGRLFYTTDGTDPRLPESALHVATATLFGEDAYMRVHAPLGEDDGFVNAPAPDVGHWKLNNDYSDSAYRPGEDPPVFHDGNPYGNVRFAENRNGDENAACTFDGKDDFIYIGGEEGGVFETRMRGDITISCWVKYTEHRAQAGIVTKGTSSWMLCQAAAEGKLRFNLAGIGNLISEDPWNDGEWHHIAAVRRYDEMILYVDGAPNGTLSIDGAALIPTAPSWLVFIGSNHELWYDEQNEMIRDIESFEGEIDDVRLYSRGLWPWEIERVMIEGEFWARPDYDDSEWLAGNGGAGYEIGTDDFAEYIGIDVKDDMYDANSTCCIRIPFEVDSTLGEVLGMTLRIRYDDGFVAYLNGYEVARSNVWGQAAWNSTALADRANAEAAEAEAFDLTRYRHLLRPGWNVFGILGVNYIASSPDFLVSAELTVDEHVVVSETASLFREPFTLEKSSVVRARTLSKAGQWSAINEATYAVGPVAENLQVTEIMYHPADVDEVEPNCEFIELRNVGEETINLSLVQFTEGIHFTFGDVELAGGEYVVVVADEEEFATAYPDFDGLIAGEYGGRLDNSGERVRLADAYGRTICDFKYSDGWYAITDGDGFSLTLRDEAWRGPREIDGAAAHWRLDERSSDTAPDSSGNGHTALLFGEPVWRYGKGMADGALLFDGIDDYVQAEEYAGIGGSGARTCAAWIRTKAAGGAIVGWGQSGSGGKWSVGINEDGLLEVEMGGGRVAGSTAVNDGRWHHIAAVSGGGSASGIRLYVDGRREILSSTSSVSISTSGGGLATIGSFDEEGPFFAGLIDDVRIYAAALDDAAVEGLYARGNWPGEKRFWRPSAYVGGSPGGSDAGVLPEPGAIKINEVLAHSHGEAPDWIELHNASDSSVNIGGWFLSDSSSNYQKFEIPAGTTIGGGGYVVFYEDEHFGNSNHSGCRSPFALSEDGESVYVRSGLDGEGNLTGYYEEEAFDASETGVAFGRYQKSGGTYNFVAMSENTPGAANAYPKVGPVVISEIMYNPASGGTWDHNEYEYLELLNIGESPVALQEWDNEAKRFVPWRFTDGITFEFGLHTVLGAGERLLLVKNPTAFLERHGDPGVVVLGPYDGRLDNGGEKVTLSKPGESAGDRYYYIRVDRVVYENKWPWPAEAAGGGKSLERINASDYGNDVLNWRAAEPTPGE